MSNFTESRDILKKENENFFDIDFKQEKVKTSEKKQDTDFFDFSMKPDKKVLKEEKETLDFESSEDVAPSVDAIESAEEYQAEIVEVVAEDVIAKASNEVQEEIAEEENSAKSLENIAVEDMQEELDVNNDNNDDDVIIETPKYSPATEVTSENQEEVQAEASVEKSDESSVEIPVEVPTPEVQERVPVEAPEDDDVIINVVKWGKVAPESQIKTVEPKKSNLVIDLEDGFEIKMCNFRGLSQKEKDSDKNIKKN